jgi:hypothetical protein
MRTKEPQDLLERWNFIPNIQDSRRNPFLREHLPVGDLRPLERASIAVQWFFPSAAMLTGIAIGMWGGGFWFSGGSPWEPLGLAALFFCFWFRASRRIDAAWAKALAHWNETP